MKPTKNFKLPAVFKYLASTITDDEKRSVFRRIAIQAVLQSEIKPAKEAKRNPNRGVELAV